MKILTVFLFFLISIGCAARFPTEKEWSQMPYIQKDDKRFLLQGNFKDINEFVQAAVKLEHGMSLEEVKELGFSTDDVEEKNACDKLGWIEASEFVLQNTHLMIDFDSLEEIIEGKKQYSGVRCQAIDRKSRTDRWGAYINNADTYKVGREINMILIFKKGVLFGININNTPIKEHNRESAFLKVLGDIFSSPRIESLTIKK